MVTTIEQLKNVKKEFEAELPPFLDGTPLTAKLRYLDVAEVLETVGNIANPLIPAVNEVTGNNSGAAKPNAANTTEDDIKALIDKCKPAAIKALVEPTYDDICKYAGGLTAVQIEKIYYLAVSQPAEQYEKFC